MKVSVKKPYTVNWDKPSVVENDTMVIVLTNGNHFGDGFQGTIIANGTPGKFCQSWEKSAFKPFTGAVTIEG